MKLRRDRAHQRSTEEETVFRRLNREAKSAVVSYTSDEETATRVGQGATMEARIADADSQLPPGEWLRVCVSTPTAIYADLIGRPRDARESNRNNAQGMAVYPRYERKIVLAAKGKAD